MMKYDVMFQTITTRTKGKQPFTKARPLQNSLYRSHSAVKEKNF